MLVERSGVLFEYRTVRCSQPEGFIDTEVLRLTFDLYSPRLERERNIWR